MDPAALLDLFRTAAGSLPTRAVVVIVICTAILVIWGGRRLRRLAHADQRENLGLKEDETLDGKIRSVVTDSFSAVTAPLLTEIRDLAKDVAALAQEVRGMRKGVSVQGSLIQDAQIQLAALTSQVGGLPAVDAMRRRVAERRAAAVARSEPEEVEP